MSSTAKPPKSKAIFILLAIALVVVVYLTATKSTLFGLVTNDRQARAVWEKLPGVKLADGLVGIALSPDGEAAAILVNNGQVMMSQDGGVKWGAICPPLEDREIHFAPCIAMPASDRVLYGTTVDDGSPYAGLYEVTTSGRREVWSGEYGGLFGATHNGQIFVGQNGLLLRLIGGRAEATQLPPCGQQLLYDVGQSGERVIAVGVQGTTLISEDGGRTWQCKRIDGNPELHRVSISDNLVLMGGAGGSLWAFDPETNGLYRGEGTQSWMSVWSLYQTSNPAEAFAAGGDSEGIRPFILRTTDGGRTWSQESVSGTGSRIMGIAEGRAGLFAITFDGHVLVRRPAPRT